jgi:hypothetical protein
MIDMGRQKAKLRIPVIAVAASIAFLAPVVVQGETASAEATAAPLPQDTFPYKIKVVGTGADDLKIEVNDYPATSLKSYSSNFETHLSAPFLYSEADNHLTVSTSSSTPLKVTVTRGDHVICEASAGNECLFQATPAYDLAKLEPGDILDVPCADAAFLEQFFAPLTDYQRYQSERFFHLDSDGLENCAPALLRSDDFSVSATFDAAPSPNPSLHTQFGPGTSVTLLTRPDIASKPIEMNTHQDALQADAHLIIDVDGTARRLPVSSPYDAIILLSQTR